MKSSTINSGSDSIQSWAGGELFPPGDGHVGIEQLAEIGSGRGRGNADELELRGIVAGNFAGIEGGMAP